MTESKDAVVDDAKAKFLQQAKEAEELHIKMFALPPLEPLHKCDALYCHEDNWGFCVACELIHFPSMKFVVPAKNIYAGSIRFNAKGEKIMVILFWDGGELVAAEGLYRLYWRCKVWKWYFQVYRESLPFLHVSD
jgi:hypothetical protein